MKKILICLSCALCLLPCGAHAEPRTPELSLNAENTTKWLIEDEGISIALTSGGARNFHLLAAQQADKPPLLYLEGRLIAEAEMRESASGPMLVIPFSDAAKAQMLKLFQDETVCDDADERCWLPRAVLRRQ